MEKIDIDKLSEAELVDLNHRIVERLHFLNQMRAHSNMLDFKIGERVTFHPDGHPTLFGIVIRYNQENGYGHYGVRSTLERCAGAAAPG